MVKLPLHLRRLIRFFFIRTKYDVVLGRNADISLASFFEGKNWIGDNCCISDSWIGKYSYIASDSSVGCARIGRFCSIGQHVTLGMGRHPAHVFVCTHPAFFSKEHVSEETFVDDDLFPAHQWIVSDLDGKKYEVVIGNDVWLGNDVKVMDGIRIGDGAIVGVGSIVTRDIEPYSINVGVPAKRIGYRFNDEQRRFLLGFKWWNRDLDWIKKNALLFSDIEKFMREFKRTGVHDG